MPIAVSACAFVRIPDFLAINSSSRRENGLAFAFTTSGLLNRVFAEADSVSRRRERANNHIRPPPERVVPRLRDLLPVPPPEFVGNLGPTDLQHLFSFPGAVVRA